MPILQFYHTVKYSYTSRSLLEKYTNKISFLKSHVQIQSKNKQITTNPAYFNENQFPIKKQKTKKNRGKIGKLKGGLTL